MRASRASALVLLYAAAAPVGAAVLTPGDLVVLRVSDASGALSGYLHLKDVLYADEVERHLPVPVKRVRKLATVRPADEVEDS